MQYRVKKIFFIFIMAWLLNAAWENLHAGLYVHHQGGAITEMILLRAAVTDAVLILAGMYLASQAPRRFQVWCVLAIGLMMGVVIEYWAIYTERWAYAPAMPLVPFLHIGLSPTVQLALTGAASYLFVKRVLKEQNK
jgi:hypothetical protein